MNILHATEAEFAGALASLTPANPTQAQRELAEQLLHAFLAKSMAVDSLSLDLAKLKSRMGALQVNIGEVLRQSLVQSPGQLGAPMSAAAADVKPASLTPPRLLSVVRSDDEKNAEAKRAFDGAPREGA